MFHVRDGAGIKQLIAAGVQVAVISGRSSKMVSVRCRELGVEHVVQGDEDKVAAFEKLRKKLKIAVSESACVGDDSADVPLMKVVKLAFAVADAHKDALRAAHVVTVATGRAGRGSRGLRLPVGRARTHDFPDTRRPAAHRNHCRIVFFGGEQRETTSTTTTVDAATA